MQETFLARAQVCSPPGQYRDTCCVHEGNPLRFFAAVASFRDLAQQIRCRRQASGLVMVPRSARPRLSRRWEDPSSGSACSLIEVRCTLASVTLKLSVLCRAYSPNLGASYRRCLLQAWQIPQHPSQSIVYMKQDRPITQASPIL